MSGCLRAMSSNAPIAAGILSAPRLAMAWLRTTESASCKASMRNESEDCEPICPRLRAADERSQASRPSNSIALWRATNPYSSRARRARRRPSSLASDASSALINEASMARRSSAVREAITSMRCSSRCSPNSGIRRKRFSVLSFMLGASLNLI